VKARPKVRAARQEGLAGVGPARYSNRMSADDDLEIRRKKALFRAQRRGFRELDLIFAAFADAHLATLGADDIERFEDLLQLPDWQIFDWIMGAAPVPPAYDHALFARLRDYRSNLGL
jgi:antitoxin CptB